MNATTKQPALQPGIYFGLDPEIYHADTALSRSDILNLLDTPRTYYDNSWMNEHRAEKRFTQAQRDNMAKGSAHHCMLFEHSEYNDRFRVVPVDMHRDPETRIAIKLEDHNAISAAIRVLREAEDINIFLKGGAGEVTIVFEDGGILYRTRHDYFTPVCTTDFKGTNSLNEFHLRREYRERGLDIQFALYRKSRIMFRRQYKAGTAHVYGKVDKVMFDQFLQSENDHFLTIFQRWSEPYPLEGLMPEDDTEEEGLLKIDRAVKRYNNFMEIYGPKRRWPACDGKIKPFSMKYGIRDDY